MKHLSQDKYTIAWFKLAECVSRGEKERAFGVYRLLAHSIDNDAFACQLQGDLYFSFDDLDAAITKYFDAAHLYEAQERYLEAAAVYENLLSLKPHTERNRERVIALYQRLNIPSKEIEHRIALIEQQMGEHKFKDAQAQLVQLDDEVDGALVCAVFEKFILASIELHELSPNHIEVLLQKLTSLYLKHDLHKAMRLFLGRLQAIDQAWHDKASKMLKD